MELLEIRDRVRPMMKDRRYLHTLGTEETAYDLAIIHGCDLFKARLTALLHDCAKNLPGEKMLQECIRYGISITKTEQQRTELLHAKLGVVYAREKFGIEDEEILNAIRYHTTGRPGMTLLEKIIFTADFIEPYRKPLPNLNEIRWAAYNDLDLAVTLIAKSTLDYLERKGAITDSLTRETYDYYKSLSRS